MHAHPCCSLFTIQPSKSQKYWKRGRRKNRKFQNWLAWGFLDPAYPPWGFLYQLAAFSQQRERSSGEDMVNYQWWNERAELGQVTWPGCDVNLSLVEGRLVLELAGPPFLYTQCLSSQSELIDGHNSNSLFQDHLEVTVRCSMSSYCLVDNNWQSTSFLDHAADTGTSHILASHQATQRTSTQMLHNFFCCLLCYIYVR